MKRTFLTILAILLISLLFAQDSIMPLLHQKFPAHELKSDLAFIKNKAVYKKYNYGGLIYAGKKNFYRLYDSIEKVIDKNGEMSRLEFYYLTAPLVNLLEDDYSYYSIAGDFTRNPLTKKVKKFADKFIIPYMVYLFNDSVFILNDTSELDKSLLISINGIPASKIVTELNEPISFSRSRYINANNYGIASIYSSPLISHTVFGFENSVELKYIPYNYNSIESKEIELFQIQDSTFHNYLRSQHDTISWYKLSFDQDIAILRIKSTPKSVSIDFFNDVFKTIKDNNAKSLVLDISSCYFSVDFFWHVFLNYIYDGELWIFEYHKEKRDLTKYIKKRLKDSNSVLGKYSDINKENKFNGDFYIITGPITSGAAVRLTERLKFNNIVNKTYGRETLSKSSQFDFPKTYYLPNTGLQLRLSITFFSALDKNRNHHGLFPDIIVEPENSKEFLKNYKNKVVIDKVVKLIKEEKQKGPQIMESN